jgi:hypothetical protein
MKLTRPTVSLRCGGSGCTLRPVVMSMRQIPRRSTRWDRSVTLRSSCQWAVEATGMTRADGGMGGAKEARTLGEHHGSDGPGEESGGVERGTGSALVMVAVREGA